MFRFKKSLLLVGAAALLFSGCKAAEANPEGGTREVSSESRGFGQSGLLVEEGELKESGASYEDAPIEFQDEVIEEMLRNIIGKPDGEVYISELQEIHAIYWRHDSYWSNLQSPDGKLPYISGNEGPWNTKQPDNLEDLKYCYNLQWMEFGNIEVPSLEPLLNLSQLETLQFHGAGATEEVLAEIGEFSVLKSFALGVYDLEYGTDWGELTDGSFLIPVAEQLTNLWACGGIDWNPEVLARMTEMNGLFIEYADDLSFLEQMTELEKLSLYCCTPEDWSPLASLEKLEHLNIGGNMYTTVEIELDDLRPLTNLDYLRLSFTSINKEHSREEIIDALPGLTGLVSLLE